MLKKIIIAAFILPLAVTSLKAQTEEEKKIKEEIWKNAPAEFRSTDVPAKWEDESAIILATGLDYDADFATKMKGLSAIQFYVEKVVSHHRIILLDKAAVKEYSELTFNEKYVNKNVFGKSSSYFIIAVKVIKPNGTEKEIDLSKAVKADSDSRKELKIAIPDLAPGDIIDYFSAGKQEYPVGYEGTISDNFLFEGDYPVVKRTMRFKLPQEYVINSKVYNGAPDFIKTTQDRDVVYTLEDNMRGKSENVLWTYKHRTAPEIRFKKLNKGVYSTSAEQAADNYMGRFTINLSNISFIADYMNENMKKEKDPVKLVNEAYYLLRNPIYLQAYFNIEQGHPLDLGFVDDQYFELLSKYLIKNRISHNIMVVPSAEFGSLAEQMSLNYADAVIRVNTTPPIYIPRVKPFAIPNEMQPEYEGMQGVVSTTYPKNTGNGDLSTSVPVSTMDQNITITTLNVSLNSDDNSKVDVKRNVLVKGHNKEAHQFLVVTSYDYLKEYDQPKYQAQSSHLIGGILKQYNKEKLKLEQRITQDYNERDKKLKDDIEGSMSVKVGEYRNFKLKTIGMWAETPNTEYSDEFNIENLTKKAGPNYILELPKLIEKQTEITEKQKKRDRDIYMSYARSFVNEIYFTIPDGYTVEGLENLNKEVKNSTGGFISTATVEGNVLKITSKKYYSGNYFEAAEWPKMVEFLNAAVDFTNAKVLLKKK